ncbi:MAG: hypothetical protein FWF60_04030 [Oscillospiraceae bacterium]|nr:hypothetical protein [Oscillospiraceae bacterium]
MKKLLSLALAAALLLALFACGSEPAAVTEATTTTEITTTTEAPTTTEETTLKAPAGEILEMLLRDELPSAYLHQSVFNGYWYRQQDETQDIPAAQFTFLSGNVVKYWVDGMDNAVTADFSLRDNVLVVDGIENTVTLFSTEREAFTLEGMNGSNQFSGMYTLCEYMD